MNMAFRESKMAAQQRGSILLMVLVLIIVVSYVLTKFVERANEKGLEVECQVLTSRYG